MNEKKKLMKQIAAYSTLGLEMGLSVGVGVLVGYYLDRFFKSYPWLTIIFIFFGFGAAIKALIQRVREIQKNEE